MRANIYHAIIGACILAATVHAADPPAPRGWPVKDWRLSTEFGPEGTARLIKQLASEDFATRERASAELKDRGPSAYPGLNEAVVAADNPEVIARVAIAVQNAEVILPLGAPTEMKAVADKYALLRHASPELGGKALSDAILALLKDDTGDRAAVMISSLQVQEVNPRLVAVLKICALNNAGTYARQAMIMGDFDAAQRLLREALNQSPEIIADYIALRALRTGGNFDPDKELAAVAAYVKTRPAKDQLQSLLNRAKARPAGGGDEVEGLIKSKDFHSLANSIDAERESTQAEWRRELLLVAGVDAESARVLQKDLHDQQVLGFVKRLNLFGHLLEEDPRALAQREESLDGDACRILCGQLRVREALAALRNRNQASPQLVRQLREMGLARASRDLAKDLRPDVDVLGRAAPGFELDLAAELRRAGEIESATRMQALVFERVEKTEAAIPLWQQDLRELEKKRVQTLKGIAWAAPIGAGSDLQRELEFIEVQTRSQANRLSQQQAMLFHAIDYSHDAAVTNAEESRELDFWAHHPDGAMKAENRYRNGLKILNGELPVEQLLGMAALEKIPPSSLLILKQVMDRVHKMHRDDLGVDVLRRYCELWRDGAPMSIAGDWALQKKDSAAAIACYQQALPLRTTDASLMYRMGAAYALQSQTRAIGEELMRFAPCLVLGNEPRASELADAMNFCNGNDSGSRWYDAYVERYRVAGDSSAFVARRLDVKESAHDYAGALALFKSASVLPRMPEDDVYPYYRTIMMNLAEYHRLAALDGLSRKDFEAVADGLERSLGCRAPDVDLLERTLPALALADAGAAARVLKRAEDRLRAVVQDYPEVEQYQKQLQRLRALGK